VNDIPAQRQRQPVVFLLPPRAQVLANLQALFLPGQLPFMDDQARLRFAGADGLKNPVKRNDDKMDFVRRQLQPELQRQKSAGHGPGHGDFSPRQIGAAERFFGHEHRPVAVAHAGPARQQGILRTDISVSMNADRRNIQFPPGGPLVQGLDVLQNMLEQEAAGGDQVFGQPIKHKSIIGIRRMSQR
jgi:hypothetical protein